VTTVRRLLAPSPASLVALLTAPADATTSCLPDGLRRAVCERLGGGGHDVVLRLDAFAVERGPARFGEPFRWTVRASRRTLGTAALRHLEDRVATDPLRAATEAIEALCDRAHRGLARRGTLGTWLATQPAAVRAACAVAAATWATAVAHVVDLDLHHDVVAVGVPDAWVEVPGARTTLHGRADAVGRAEGRGVLRVRDGAPGPRALDGLAVDGLLASLVAGGADRPARILGAWPDAGLCVVVELDAETLRRGARALVRAAPSPKPVVVSPPLAA